MIFNTIVCANTHAPTKHFPSCSMEISLECTKVHIQCRVWAPPEQSQSLIYSPGKG